MIGHQALAFLQVPIVEENLADRIFVQEDAEIKDIGPFLGQIEPVREGFADILGHLDMAKVPDLRRANADISLCIDIPCMDHPSSPLS
jgi:hypothetical protein